MTAEVRKSVYHRITCPYLVKEFVLAKSPLGALSVDASRTGSIYESS
jgi:hypothetical protein